MPIRKKRSSKRAVKRSSLRKRFSRKKAFNFEKLEASLHKTFRKYFKTYFKEYGSSLTYFLPIFAAAIVMVLFFKATPKHAVTLDSAKLYQNFQQAQEMSTGEKIDYWSKALLKKPDLLKVLGKGPKVNDIAPLFPPGYDCTTFVETVAALSRSKDSSELADRLIEIRYKNGDVSYVNRNHFPEADWIPNNQSAGVLKDITVSVARASGFLASFINKDINKTAWFKAQRVEQYYRSVAATDGAKDETTVKLAYIPLDRALEVATHIPNGAVINVVRENKASQPVLVTHQAFLVWKNGVAYLRHASRFKEITEVPFKQYIREVSKMPWKVVGININEIRS